MEAKRKLTDTKRKRMETGVGRSACARASRTLEDIRLPMETKRNATKVYGNRCRSERAHARVSRILENMRFPMETKRN